MITVKVSRYKYLSINVYSPQIRVHSFLLLVTLHFVGKTVAWAISSKEETAHMIYFFEVVKKASPDATVATLMSDDGVYKFNKICLLCF